MIRKIISFSTVAALTMTFGAVAGCNNGSANAGADPYAGSQGYQREQIAFAAQASYPTTQPNEADIVAIVQDEQMLLANLSSEAYRDVSIWVNGNYVRNLRSLPPHGRIPIPLTSFYDRDGVPFTQFSSVVESVTMAAENDVFGVKGPVRLAGDLN